jgi:hypothetical protein
LYAALLHFLTVLDALAGALQLQWCPGCGVAAGSAGGRDYWWAAVFTPRSALELR